MSIHKRPRSKPYEAKYRGPDGVMLSRSFRTKKEAETWEAMQIADQARGVWTSPRTGDVSLGDYAVVWLANKPQLAPRSHELYHFLLRKYVLPYLGTVSLAKINPQMVRQWNATLIAKHPGTLVPPKAYRTLRAIMNTAVEDELILRSPCVIKGAGIETNAERPVASPEQVWQLAEAIEPRFRALILVAGFAGLRWGELCALTRSKLDLEAGTITIDEKVVELTSGEMMHGPPKTEAGRRTFLLPAFLIDELAVHMDRYVAPGPDGQLFTGVKGGTIRRTHWSTTFRHVAGPLGMSHMTFHDLRHTANTISASTGATVRELMHRMGHASPEASLRYLHATKERDNIIAQAVNAIALGTRPREPQCPQGPQGTENTDRNGEEKP